VLTLYHEPPCWKTHLINILNDLQGVITGDFAWRVFTFSNLNHITEMDIIYQRSILPNSQLLSIPLSFFDSTYSFRYRRPITNIRQVHMSLHSKINYIFILNRKKIDPVCFEIRNSEPCVKWFKITYSASCIKTLDIQSIIYKQSPYYFPLRQYHKMIRTACKDSMLNEIDFHQSKISHYKSSGFQLTNESEINTFYVMLQNIVYTKKYFNYLKNVQREKNRERAYQYFWQKRTTEFMFRFEEEEKEQHDSLALFLYEIVLPLTELNGLFLIINYLKLFSNDYTNCNFHDMFDAMYPTCQLSTSVFKKLVCKTCAKLMMEK
jgi:hypothetical protein